MILEDDDLSPNSLRKHTNGILLHTVLETIERYNAYEYAGIPRYTLILNVQQK
jgi:hypothetical protein